MTPWEALFEFTKEFGQFGAGIILGAYGNHVGHKIAASERKQAMRYQKEREADLGRQIADANARLDKVHDMLREAKAENVRLEAQLKALDPQRETLAE